MLKNLWSMAETGQTELRPTLQEVTERIARYQGSTIGEQNTKMALIVPILRSLGWDVEDLDEVRLEYRRRTSDKPVDYALMLQRDPALFLEAKALGENLDDPRWANQVISYAAVAGVEWVVLTDGDRYRIYNAHAPVPVEEKLFRSIRLSGDLDESVDALRLLSKDEVRSKSLAGLWHRHSVDSRVARAVHGLFAPEPSEWLIRRLAREIEGLSAGDVRAALVRARISLDLPAAEQAPATSSRTPRKAAASARPAPVSYEVTLADLMRAGLLKRGAELRKRYLGQEVTARAESDGSVRFRGKTYRSLSTAAGVARVSVKGPPPDSRAFYQTNGWSFWEFQAPDGRWQPISVLRTEFLKGR